MDHRNNFDLLRLFAAIDVMLSHAIEHLKLPVWPWIAEIVVSFPGVPIFFVISGFLITETFFKRNGMIAPYLANRALRIYPALWLNLLFILTQLVAFGVLKPETLARPTFFASSAILVATGSGTIAIAIAPLPFHWNENMPFFPGGALWTIVVELGFYLMVPLVFLAPFRNRRPLAFLSLGFWALASYAIALYLETHPSDLLSFASPFPNFWVFAIGSASSLAWPKIKFLFEDRLKYWLAVYVALCVCLRYTIGMRVPDYQNPAVISTGLVLALSGMTLAFAFSYRRLSTVLRGNDISYGVYLHHMPIAMIFLATGLTASIWVLPAFSIAVFSAAAASWFLLERPMLTLKRRSLIPLPNVS